LIRRLRVAGIGLLAALAVLSFFSPRAHAGVYNVYACRSWGDVRNASWYGIGGSPGTAAYAACPAGDYHPYDTGLGARTTGGASSRVGLNGGSWAQLDAPPGTSLHSIWFHGALGGQVEGGCWEAGISGWTSDFYAAPLFWGLQPCHITSGGWMANQVVALGGNTHARVGIRCASPSGCQADWNGGHGVWANLRDVTVVVQDDLPPSVTPTHGALLEPRWQRGVGDAWAAYADNTGIRRTALAVDGVTYSTQDYDNSAWAPYGLQCDNAHAVPCHDLSADGHAFDTRGVADGRHVLRLSGADSAGNWSSVDRTLLVDNHAPGGPFAISVAGGEGWRRANRFDVAWSNPDQGDASPIVEARYRLCRVAAPSECREGSRAGTGISAVQALAVPTSGDWTLQVWLVDAAGNVDATRASDPVRLRFDPQVDGAAFEAPDRGDPRRLVVAVTDHLSGVAPGTIELRRRGRTAWRALPTALAGTRLTALVPDTELADGPYELRALAHDIAGNERVADRYADGSRAVIVLPLRSATRLLGAASAAPRRTCSIVTRTVRRGGRRVRVRHRVCRTTTARAALGGTLAVPFGRAATVRGALQTYSGRPVAGAAVLVDAEPRTGGSARRAATLRTAGDGTFAYRVPAGPSRMLHFAFPGDEVLAPTAAHITLRVPAGATLHSSRRTVRNGASVTFSGRLIAPPPEAGKLVTLQAFYRRAWRTFAVARTDARGRFRQAYRFQATVGRVAYHFRARIEREASYPYETGVTPVVTVLVRG
jgi:hypothetical protein